MIAVFAMNKKIKKRTFSIDKNIKNFDTHEGK